tara:strand:+ start:12231 stop:16139 length:3909 start_codon:yes stop_codon:yes gene_type:complete
MPQPYRARFEKSGKRCPRNLEKLKRLPECGYFERREFVPQVNPPPPVPGQRFDPFAPGQTLPQRTPRGIPGIPNDPPGRMPGQSGVDDMSLRYPQDTMYPLPSDFGGTEYQESLTLGHPRRQAFVKKYGRLYPENVPRGYTRVPDLGDYEMDGFNLQGDPMEERQPRTRLFDEGRPSRGGLRRREISRNFTPESNFTGRAGVRHRGDTRVNIDTAGFDTTGEFTTPGTRAFPAQDIESGITEDRQLLRPTQSRRSQTLRLMEQARARTATFATNRAAELQENARTLARNIAETAENVQTDMTRSFASSYRRGYTNIGRAARISASPDVELPSFDIEAQMAQPTPEEQRAFRDGTFDIEQGVPESSGLSGRTFTEQVTGLRQSNIESTVLEDAPFETLDTLDTQAGRDRTFSERLGAIGDSKLAVGSGAVGSAGIGLAAGYGIATLMGDAGADPYSTAFVSSATGDIAGRWSAIGAQSLGKVALQRFGIAAGEEATETIARQLAISGLRGTAEGGLAGLALAPVDIALNQAFLNAGMNHANAGAAASGITGAAFLGGVGAVSLATAPETLGLSLVVGGIVAGIGTLVSWITGHNQDEEEKKKRQERQRKIDSLNTANNQRSVLISLMPSSNYDLNTALANYKRLYGQGSYNQLGVGNDSWASFSTNVNELFTDGPPPHAQKGGKEPTGDDKRINDLYQKYVANAVINRICAGKSDCALSPQNPGPLSANDVKFLNDKAGPIWQSQANLAVNMTVGQANFHHELMATAQQKIIDGWNNERKLPKDFDAKTQRDAAFDDTFLSRFNAAAEADAQRDIVQGYISSRGSKTMDQFPPNVREMALKDPSFQAKYDTYLSQMRNASVNLNVTIPQLIDLQALGSDPQKQQAKYKEIQFDNAKENVNVVAQAAALEQEEQAITKVGFYDIDSAFLQTDPTKIGEWHPTDAQIIQASRAGMTLQQYVDYLTELAKGDAGDFSKLPSYTDAQLTAQGELDFHHLQDDLQLAGYSKDYYIYDPKTRTYTINPNAATTPDEKLASHYQSQYTPEYLVEARNEYAKMITNMNQSFSDRTDAYNKALRNQLASDSLTYYQQMQPYNIMLSQQATALYTPLLTLDAEGIYNANAMHFHPLSTEMPGRQLGDKDDKPTQIIDHHGKEQAIANANLTAKQLAEIAAAKKMGYVGDDERILQDYIDTKKAIEASGIRDPTQAQVDTYYQHIKQIKGEPEIPEVSDSKGKDVFGADRANQNVKTEYTPTVPSTSNTTNLQKDFRDANPNLNQNTSFTDNQVRTLNSGGSVKASDGQTYASA